MNLLIVLYEAVKSYLQAGRVWAKVKYFQKKAKEGVLLFDLAEGVEKLIVEEGPNRFSLWIQY